MGHNGVVSSYTISTGLMGMCLDHCIHCAFPVLCPNMLHDYVLCVVNYIHGKIYMEKKEH